MEGPYVRQKNEYKELGPNNTAALLITIYGCTPPRHAASTEIFNMHGGMEIMY